MSAAVPSGGRVSRTAEFDPRSPRSIVSLADRVTGVCGVLFALGLFGWISAAALYRGLDNGDDGFFALAAKAVATGPGYGLWASSDDFVAFDPLVGVGPALILPIALVTRLAGPTEWGPGATALGLFVGQMAAVVVLLRRALGTARTLPFVVVVLLLLQVVSFPNWYFGLAFGEPVALGFLLLAGVLLATGPAAVGRAALCFSLAFLTKQISFFASAAMVLVWLRLTVVQEGAAWSARRTARLALVASGPIAAFEVWKAVSLGSAYPRLLRSMVGTTVQFAVGGGGWGERLAKVAHVVTTWFAVPTAAIVLVAASVFAYWRWGRDANAAPVSRLVLLLCAGTFGHLVYVAALSVLWTRYFWIGIALGCCALAAPTLSIRNPVVRTACVLVAAEVFVFTGPFERLQNLHSYLVTTNTADERREVVRLLQAFPTMPLAASDWGELFGLVYLDPARSRPWAYGEDVERLRGREFLGVAHRIFTDQTSVFYRTMSRECTRATARPTVTTFAFNCGAAFWAAYPAPQRADAGGHVEPGARP